MSSILRRSPCLQVEYGKLRYLTQRCCRADYSALQLQFKDCQDFAHKQKISPEAPYRVQSPAATIMPGPTNTLLIEGSFEELADELAHYLDEVKRKDSDAQTTIQTDIAPLLEQNQKDEVLKKLVTGGAVLNSAPEKGFILLEISAGYNS